MTVESIDADMDFDDHIDAMSALLGPDDDNPKQPQKVSEKSTEDPEEAEEAELEESEGEGEGAEEEQQDEDPATDNFEELEIDGEKVKLPADIAAKIKPRILMHQDYTRKTMEVAEMRKAIEAESAQTQTARNQYVQGMQLLQQVLQNTLPPQPDARLLDDDPIEYMRQERAWKEAQSRVHHVAAAQAQLARQVQAEQEAQWQRSLQEASAKLVEMIPAWKDSAKAKAERESLISYLAEQGYSKEEIGHASDPRAIALSRKAWLYDQMIAQKKAAKPTPPKVAAAGSPRNPKEDSRSRLFKQARQSGRVEDAAAALESLL